MSGPGISSTQDPVTGYNIIIMLQVRREKYFKTSKIVQLRYAEKDSEELRDLLRERDVIMAALTSGAN